MLKFIPLPFLFILFLLSVNISAAETSPNYVVVVREKTHADAGWQKVVDALVAKHGGKDAVEVCTYDKSVTESLAALQKTFPKYACFVATPEEAGRQFVTDVHQMTRKLDDDPYTDVFWGILTGYDAENALSIASHKEPLTIRKVAGGTEIALEMCEQGIWYCELEKNKVVKKTSGKEAEAGKGPDDTTAALVDVLNDYEPDLWVTSGHATERNWQIGYRYRNGYFRCNEGQLFGSDTSQEKFDVHSDNPKIYMPIGNCLAGHIDSQDAMALAYMKSAGVKQMVGYTVLTWFGYGGWGCLDYFVEQPGRYTFNEAFFANHHALIHKLGESKGKPDERGLTYDRDVVAFYGDPAWEARMATAEKAYDQTLTEADGVYTLTITLNRGEKSFEPVNTNGAQRGWRPIVAFLPERIGKAEIVSGSDLNPVITDDFILIPNPRTADPSRTYEVKFKAATLE